MRIRSLLLFSCLLGIPVAAPAAIIYDNTVNSGGVALSFDGNFIVEAGDQVAFDGTERLLTQVIIEVFNESLTQVTGATATLRLYKVSGNVLGTLITSVTLAPANFAASSAANLVFNLPSVAVPNELVWTLSFSDPNLGLNYYDPPVTGTSGDQAWWDTGLGLQETAFPFGVENYNAQFNAEAVPEPSTYALMGLGLIVAARHRRRRVQ